MARRASQHPERLATIEARLRELAGKLDGRLIGHHVIDSYKGPTRQVGITVVEDDGTDTDLAGELLRLADDVAMVGAG